MFTGMKTGLYEDGIKKRFFFNSSPGESYVVSNNMYVPATMYDSQEKVMLTLAC
jgi:hypothetical protein